MANFIYDGDAPLAERRAQALSVDQAQLKELLGEAELRELLDARAIEELERSLQRLEGRPVSNPDALHDLLLSLGDLTEEEIRVRSAPPEAAARWLAVLTAERRVIAVTIGGERRFAAAEDAARLRDALGIPPPPGLPESFLEDVADPLGDLVSRWRGRTARSGRRTSRRASAFRSRRSARRSNAWSRTIASSRASSCRAVGRGSGPTPVS